MIMVFFLRNLKKMFSRKKVKSKGKSSLNSKRKEKKVNNNKVR